MAAKLLKPAKAGEQFKSLSIKIPSALAERLAALQQCASSVDMTVDVDGQLSKSLARLVRSAEVELGVAQRHGGGGNDVQ